MIHGSKAGVRLLQNTLLTMCIRRLGPPWPLLHGAAPRLHLHVLRMRQVLLVAVGSRRVSGAQQADATQHLLERRLQARDAGGRDADVALEMRPHGHVRVVPTKVAAHAVVLDQGEPHDGRGAGEQAHTHHDGEDQLFAQRHMHHADEGEREQREDEVFDEVDRCCVSITVIMFYSEHLGNLHRFTYMLSLISIKEQ